MASMTLIQFISEVGDAKAALLFDVKERTAASWRRNEAYPRATKAREIIAKRPDITMDGIYGKQAAQC